MSSRIHHLRFWFLLCALALVTNASSQDQDQTYKVNGGTVQQPPPPQKSKSQTQTKPAEKSLGWGSNIQNARLARAAETALRNHNYAAAVDYAQRAAQSAPNDAQLW